MKLTLTIGIVLILLLLVPATTTSTLATTDNINVFVTAGNTNIVQVPLKAIQTSSGEVATVSGFSLEPDNVIQAKQTDNLMVFTSNNANNQPVEKVKVTNTLGTVTDLQQAIQGYSIQGLSPGI